MTHSAWLHAVFAPVCRDVGVPTLGCIIEQRDDIGANDWPSLPSFSVIAVSEDTRRLCRSFLRYRVAAHILTGRRETVREEMTRCEEVGDSVHLSSFK